MNKQPVRLLFVDDEERIVKLLKAIFANEYEVHTATSGAEALQVLAATQIHVLVSDQRMPGMLGVELLERARRLSPHTTRILLTGYTDLAAIVGSVNDGEVFRYLNKPWDHGEIKQTIAEAAELAITRAGAPLVVELQATELAAPVAARSATGAILVIDDDTDVVNSIASMFTASYGVHGANTIDEAIEILRAHDIAVIITDTHVAGEDTTKLLAALKRHHPKVLTIVMTEAHDAETVINLINHVQIFRYTSKPIRRGALSLGVRTAMQQRIVDGYTPALTSVPKAAVLAGSTEEPTWVRRVIALCMRPFRARTNSVAGLTPSANHNDLD